MTRTKRSGRWRNVRLLAWERDRKAKAVCGICGQPIDYSLPPSSTPDSWEPDHIIPVSINNEQELDLNNIRASHRSCNRARNNRGIVNIGKTSRIW